MSGFEDIARDFHFDLSDPDAQLRSAAFAEIARLTRVFGDLTSDHMKAGFQFAGKQIPFANRPRGIFKPRQMLHLLSIKTVYPGPHGRVWYDDQREVYEQIYSREETIEYSFMGTNPDASANQLLRDAMDMQIPIIYFLGTAPGLYQAIVPAFIVGFDPRALKARVAFAPSESATKAPETPDERRYALRKVKQRLHQFSFRQMVIDAYKGRCAISGLPEPRLLDAAHIVDDKHEQYGQPIIGNGIPLSKIHHAAFDAHLIGVDADSRVHVSETLLTLKDGPQLEALRQFHGEKLLMPRRDIDKPDRDRLALRFEKFKLVA